MTFYFLVLISWFEKNVLQLHHPIWSRLSKMISWFPCATFGKLCRLKHSPSTSINFPKTNIQTQAKVAGPLGGAIYDRFPDSQAQVFVLFGPEESKGHNRYQFCLKDLLEALWFGRVGRGYNQVPGSGFPGKYRCSIPRLQKDWGPGLGSKYESTLCGNGWPCFKTGKSWATN